ncbi:MAG TPA: indolepyruvate oxidoreductase subunit beta [Clostridia bacterium]|nr:indolepyruvate oxidoreductase subunit beta [Clostridia bacterium]
MVKSILLVGVGGQGTILASKLLTAGLMEAGYDVKMSEIHGMSQRGGSVSTHVRYGEKVESPVIELGGADILVSFEMMEALRWLRYLRKDGKVVVNNFKINSMPILCGLADYPTGILEELSEKTTTIVVDAAQEAVKIGNAKVMNVILLGTIVKLMGLEGINWDKIIRDNVKPKFIDVNLKAIKVGMDLV